MTNGALSRPGLIESWTMGAAIFLFVAGVPWSWVAVGVRGNSTAGGDSATSLLFLSLFLLLALQMNGRWSQFFHVLGREPLLLLFLGWVLLSVLWSPAMGISIRRAIALIVTTYIAAHLVMRFSQFQILRMLASVLMSVVLLNLLWIVALPQYSGPKFGRGAAGTPLGFDDRLTGIYDNPNPLGRIMALSVFTMLAALRLDRRRRPVYLVGIGAAILVLGFSQSKTALVTSSLTSLLLIVFLVFRARRTLFGAVALSVVTAAAASVALVIANLGVITEKLGRDVTLSGRIPLWQDLIAVIPERPVLGVGYNAFWGGWGSPAHEIWNLNPWLPPHGHNQFIDIALQLGLVGLAIYCTLLFRTFVRATRYVRDVPGVFGLWPLTFSSFFLTATLTESAVVSRDILWFLLVATIVLVSMKKTSVDLAPPPNESPQIEPQVTLRRG